MDKIQAANQLNTFLGPVVKHAGFRLKYRITVDPGGSSHSPPHAVSSRRISSG